MGESAAPIEASAKILKPSKRKADHIGVDHPLNMVGLFGLQAKIMGHAWKRRQHGVNRQGANCHHQCNQDDEFEAADVFVRIGFKRQGKLSMVAFG